MLANLKKLKENKEYTLAPVSMEILSDFITPIEAIRILKAASTHSWDLNLNSQSAALTAR